MPRHLDRIYILLAVGLVAVFGFILFQNLGQRPLIDYDEAIYAQVAREALENRSQLDFTWEGNVSLGRPATWLEKPPLFIWLVEASFAIFGINEFAARLPVAIFALATAILSYIFVRKEFNSSSAALLSVAAFLVSYQFLQLGSTLQLDIPVGFFILLSLFGFAQARLKPKYWYLFGVALGLGVMTKSVVGLLPLPIIFGYGIVQRDFSWLKAKHFYYGLLIAIGIIVPWHVIQIIRNGRAFWDSYLLYHIVTRYGQALEQHLSDQWFYWNILKSHRVLFAGSVLGFFYFAFHTIRRRSVYSLVLVATAIIFLFLSSSKTRLAPYILILYPFLAIMFGVTLDRIVKTIKIKTFGSIAIFFIVAACVYFGVRYNNYRQNSPPLNVDVDNKTVGLFLRDQFPQKQLYCQCATGTRPSLVFYAGKPVYALGFPNVTVPTSEYVLVSEAKLAPPSSQSVLDTPTKSVYYINP